METGETIAVGGLIEEMEEENCPFADDVKGVSELEDEHIANDDKNSVQKVQANNGGTLGDNLNTGSNGVSGTWQGAPYPPNKPTKKSASDSRRKDGVKGTADWQKVMVPGTDTIRTQAYPFTVAAHHLIPGNASLYTDENNLQNYMLKGKTVQAGGKSWEIKYHIGYNVNGAHNGAWLCGNYAIRTGTSPTGVSWGKMTNLDWQLHYVAACVKATGGQFHDAHTLYSEAVQQLLNKIAEKLKFHQAHCRLCKEKQGEISPPYLIKQRLYRLSKYFQDNLRGSPTSWRRPWFTSDRWRDIVFKDDAEIPCNEFIDAYNQASVVETKED